MIKKICMVGLYGVGKTSLVKRFVESIFRDGYQTTVGVAISKKDVVLESGTVSLTIWDIAGEDELAAFRVSNVKGSSGYLLVADGCRSASLDKAVELHQRITDAIGPLPFVLVINKVDLCDEWEIQPDALERLASEGWHIINASAKTGDAVEQAFHTLTQDMLDRDAARAAEKG